MAKKKSQPVAKHEEAAPAPPPEPTPLDLIEAELRAISPTLKELKRADPEKYSKVYGHYLQLVQERARLKGNL